MVLKEQRAHLSGPVDSNFEATAEDIEAEAHEAVKHAFNNNKNVSIMMQNNVCFFYLVKKRELDVTMYRANSPVVENMPPMMPHSRTRNCQSGMCCSLTVTIRELVSYFTKMPETP